jgi:cobalamin biosynthesis Mg chelatase CobN
MFKTADKKGYVRQPVVTYLTVAAEQPSDVGTRAKAALVELEAFDPETVKQARSLMAFGALSRAKASGSASGNDNGSSKTASETTDDTQAFAATAEDNETDPAEIADPAEFEEAPKTDTAPVDTKQDAAKSAVAAEADSPKPEATSNTTVNNAGKANADNLANASEAPAESRPLPNTWLIVGVPLLAAGVLMGVYWVILRAGAV